MRLLALAFCFLAAPATLAQTSFGIKAGLNVATVSFDDDFEQLFDGNGVDKQPRLGLVAGVFADIALTPSLSFRPEVLYAQRGYTVAFDNAEAEPDIGDFEGSFTTQIDYIEVPLLLAYRVPVGQNGLAVGLEAGPTFAYKVSTGVGCDGDFVDVECDDLDTESDDLRDYDVSGALGLTLGAGPFGVGLRYTQGITTIDDSDVEADNVDARNRAFSVAARYTFGR